MCTRASPIRPACDRLPDSGPPSAGAHSAWPASLTSGAWPRSPAVQIYQVTDYAGLIGLIPIADLVTATGSADALARLVERGLALDRRRWCFGSRTARRTAAGSWHARWPPTASVAAKASFGQPGGLSPATLHLVPALPPSPGRHRTTCPPQPGRCPRSAYGGGVSDVRASSSGADAGALVNPRSGAPARGRRSTGTPSTAWRVARSPAPPASGCRCS